LPLFLLALGSASLKDQVLVDHRHTIDFDGAKLDFWRQSIYSAFIPADDISGGCWYLSERPGLGVNLVAEALQEHEVKA
jgi:hypothetical protein